MLPVYEPSVDAAGHDAGPDSALVDVSDFRSPFLREELTAIPCSRPALRVWTFSSENFMMVSARAT